MAIEGSRQSAMVRAGKARVDGFTSTGLVSLLVRALEEVDPGLLRGAGRPDPMDQAIVPEAAKLDLVARVMARHGPGLLLAVGQYLRAADETPALTVLLHSADPDVLAGKWMRLERYHHAFHRTRIAPVAPAGWDCCRAGGEVPPSLGANCLIAGLLLGLAGAVGLQDARLELGTQVLRPADLRGVILPSGETLRRFRVRWSPERVAEEPARGEGVEAAGGALSERLADLLAGDIGRSWRLGDAAARLALSGRSLQRRLNAEGRSFSSVLRRARMRRATELLTGVDTGLAEIGYCCGYADQAHFQRDFRRATNLTPGAFRQIAHGNRQLHSGASFGRTR